MLFFKRKKKVKEKKNKYKIAASLTMGLLFAVIIGFTALDAVDYFKNSATGMNSTLKLVTKDVDESKLISDNAPQHNFTNATTSLITKINDCNLDILTDNEIDKNKFKLTEISISKDLVLSDQEFTILASSLVQSLSDGILIERFLEITITQIDGNNYQLFTVTKLNLSKVLEGVSKLEDMEVYLVNTYTLSFNENSFSIISNSCNVNQLSAKESSDLVAMFDEIMENKYKFSSLSFYYIEQLINNFCYNTSSTFNLSNHTFTFCI